MSTDVLTLGWIIPGNASGAGVNFNQRIATRDFAQMIAQRYTIARQVVVL
ncbi:hypothetical protein ES703_101697 [subsurface metagenome]